MPGWDGAPFGLDPYARQMAKAAADAVAALAADGTRLRGCRLGSGKTGLLIALGGSADVTVLWRTPIPHEYSVEPVEGPGLIGAASLAVKSKTSTGCVITVTASGLAVAAGAVVFAHATY
jgi:hypothetical protein